MAYMLKDVAEIVGKHKDTVYYALRKKRPELMFRGNSPNGQECWMCRDEDIDEIKSLWQTQARIVPDGEVLAKTRKILPVFYLTVLDPEARPNRIKMGHSGGEHDRWDVHRTTCPEILLLSHWPCMKAWETMAMAAAVRNGLGTQVIGAKEVFDVGDVDLVEHRLDEFFFDTLENRLGIDPLEPLAYFEHKERDEKVWQLRREEFLSKLE